MFSLMSHDPPPPIAGDRSKQSNFRCRIVPASKMDMTRTRNHDRRPIADDDAADDDDEEKDDEARAQKANGMNA